LMPWSIEVVTYGPLHVSGFCRAWNMETGQRLWKHDFQSFGVAFRAAHQRAERDARIVLGFEGDEVKTHRLQMGGSLSWAV